MKFIKRFLPVLIILLLFTAVFTVTVSAATGDVAGAIQSTWDDAKTQIKTVVNGVVFPAIDLILAVLFFVKLGGAWFDYRKHGQFEMAASPQERGDFFVRLVRRFGRWYWRCNRRRF